MNGPGQRNTQREPYESAPISLQLRPIARACLADAGAQETSVILYAYLAAGQKIRDRCDHLCAAASAGTNSQD
jgi:hypothetical protein